MDNYEEKVERIKQFGEDPSSLDAHISNHIDGITEHLPNISQGISNTIYNSIGYLASKIPKPVSTLPLSGEWVPSIAQKQKFERHYEAVDNPVDILNKIKDGSLTMDHMEALQAAHPALLKEMRQQLSNQASPAVAKNLPKQIKQGLSMFLGQPLSDSDLLSVRMANQAVFQGNQQMPSNQVQQPKSTQKGLSDLKISGRAKTQTSRDELGQS